MGYEEKCDERDERDEILDPRRVQDFLPIDFSAIMSRVTLESPGVDLYLIAYIISHFF